MNGARLAAAAVLAVAVTSSGPGRAADDPSKPDVCSEAVARGKALFKGGDMDAAQAAFESAAEAAQAAGAQGCLGEALYGTGLVLDHRGEQALAAGPLDRAEALARALGDRRLLARIWNHRGLQERQRGRFDQAERYFRLSVDAFDALGERVSASAALGNLGLVCQNRGDYACGLEAHRRALELDPRNTYAMFNVAVIDELQGDDAQALEAYRKSAAIDREDGDVVHEALSVIGAGRVEARLGHTGGAIASFAEARQVLEKVGDDDLLGEVENALGEVEQRSGHAAEAVRHFAEAVRLQHDSVPHLADALQSLSAAQLGVGQPGAALESARRSLALVDGSASWGIASGAWVAIGAAQEALGDAVQARSAYEQAVALVEDGRGHVAGEEPELQRFLEQRLTPYHRLLALAVARGDQAEALRWAEQARARVLVDVLRRGRPAGPRRTSPAERARLARGEDAAVTGAGLAPLLADGSAAIAFTVAEKATYLFAFTVAPGGAVQVTTATLPQGEAAWRARALTFRGAMARRDLAIGAAAQALYRDLLAPLRSVIAGRRLLYLVPEGPLWEIPFAALQPSPHRYLAQEAALAFAPSLTALAAWRTGPTSSRPGGDWEFLGVGQARFGARAVAALYGPTAHTLLDGAATEARVKAQLGRARVLSFATHGVVEPASPLYSALLLAREPAGSAEDGRLQAREVLDLDLRADLAVLSGCDTARGRIGAGEGVIGLSWAFAVAGARNTVVSLWSVDAAGTAELMLEFHRAAQRGEEYPQALRAAELKLLRGAGTRHPFYWAPFLLIGDGRRSAPPAPAAPRAPAK